MLTALKTLYEEELTTKKARLAEIRTQISAASEPGYTFDDGQTKVSETEKAQLLASLEREKKQILSEIQGLTILLNGGSVTYGKSV